jgi:hypothetical protein
LAAFLEIKASSIVITDDEGLSGNTLTNQAIDINTLRATSVAQIKARLAGNGPSLVKSRNW